MERILRASLMGLSAAALLAFVAMAFSRLGHPLPLDPAEGVWLSETLRLVHGLPLFAAPSLSYIPMPGMPGFALLSAVPAAMAGPELWMLRLIAVLATLGTAWLVAAAVKAETRSTLFAMVAVGLLFAAFAATGSRLDVARPEAPAWFFAMAGLSTLRFTTGRLGAWGAALLLALGFFTAAHVGWFLAAALIHVLLNDRPRRLAFVLAVLVFCGGGIVLLARALGPWWSFYAWDVPLHSIHPDRVRLSAVIGTGLAGTLTPLALPVLMAAALPASLWHGRNGVWLWAVVGGAAASIVGAIEPPAISPALGPTVVALVIAGPIALVRVVSHLAAWPGSGRAGRSWVLHAILLLQFFPLAYGLRSQMPDPRLAQAHAALIERLRSLQGPVLVPGYGEAALRAGKDDAYQPLALDLLVNARGNALLARQPEWADSMFRALAGGPHPPSIVIGAPQTLRESEHTLATVLARSYRRVAEWPELADSPAPHFVYARPMETSRSQAAMPALAGAIAVATDSIGPR
jgi:hypothetical protein